MARQHYTTPIKMNSSAKAPIKVRAISALWYLGWLPIGAFIVPYKPMSLVIGIAIALVALGALTSRALMRRKEWAWYCSRVFGWSLAGVVFSPFIILFNMGWLHLPSFINAAVYFAIFGMVYYMIFSAQTKSWIKNKDQKEKP